MAAQARRHRAVEGVDAELDAGDEVVLFGPGTDGEPTAQDWAEMLGTINYEVVTSPRGRMVRTYLASAHHPVGGGAR